MAPFNQNLSQSQQMQLSEDLRRYKAFLEWTTTLSGSIHIPTFNSKEEFENFKAAYKAAAGYEGSEKQAKAMPMVEKFLHDAIEVVDSFRSGKEHTNEVVKRFVRAKVGSPLASPTMTSQIVRDYRAWQSDFAADMRWMLVFSTRDMSGNLSGKIVNFKSAVEYGFVEHGNTIKYGTIGASTEQDVYPQRSGGGLQFDTEWLRLNGYIQFNDAIMALRQKREEFISDYMWNLLATNAGDTTLFNTSLQVTMNLAAQTLRGNNKNKGYGTTYGQSYFYIHNGSHTPQVNSAIFALRGENGTNPVVEYPIIAIDTDSIPSSITQGGSTNAAGLMVLPGRDLMYLPFMASEQFQSTDRERSVIKIGQDERWNGRVGDTQQIQKVRHS